jgi:hypothetical protein
VYDIVNHLEPPLNYYQIPCMLMELFILKREGLKALYSIDFRSC